MTENVTKNNSFAKPTNLDTSIYDKVSTIWLGKRTFLSSFAYWVIYQSPYDTPDIMPALVAWNEYLTTTFPKNDMVLKFTPEQVSALITEDIFVSIPDIEKLNHRRNGRDGTYGFSSLRSGPIPDDDFIDLGALAGNVFQMIMREDIT